MPPTGNALTVTAVRKRFERRGRWVLDGVDLQLAPGSATVVTGANGSGKSTLLRIVAGLARPTNGSVAGRPRGIAFAPERLPARLRMSARAYVAHMARLRGLDGPAARARSEELFSRLGLTPGPDVPVGTLSKGNSQKVALVQALLAPVPLLVLDEPFSGLDTEARAALACLVDERVARGATALLSSHVVPDGTRHDVYLLRDGRLVAASPTAHTGMLRIVLSATSSDASPLGPGALPGVTSSHATAGGVELIVERAFGDHVLMRALGSGWSVVSVTPWEAPPPSRTVD